MSHLPSGGRMQLASDIVHDGMGLELFGPTGDLVAEIFRSDTGKTVTVKNFGQDIPLAVFEAYIRRAWHDLDPFEDGSSFASVGIARD